MTAIDVDVKLEHQCPVAARQLEVILAWWASACLIGCSSATDDLVNRVAQGKMPALRNPSQQVIAELVANPEKAKVSAVWLVDIDLTEPRWAHLQDLSKLEQISGLHLATTKNTDAFVATLPARDKIVTLEFYETDLSDSGLAEVVKLSQLEQLRLEFSSQRIAPAKLSELKSLTELKKLHLTSDTKLNPGKFKAMLRGCEVTTEVVPADLWGD